MNFDNLCWQRGIIIIIIIGGEDENMTMLYRGMSSRATFHAADKPVKGV